MSEDEQPEPQFPAPNLTEEEAAEELERLPAPPAAARKRIAAHLREKHEIGPFRLAEHVYLGGGGRTVSQHITWHPIDASFHCDLCLGWVFVVGEPGPERLRLAQHFDETLQPRLVGLSGEERDEMTRLHLDGTVNRELLRRLQAAGPRRRAASGKRPSSAEFKQRAQDWLYPEVEARGTLRAALDEAERMQAQERDAWLLIVGRLYERETLRKHWLDIDSALRDKALGRTSKR